MITVTYSDGSTEDVSVTFDMVTGYDKEKVGKQTLIVAYEGKTTSFEITVDNPVSLAPGAIAGIVIGSVFGLLIIAFAVLYVLWKRKNFNVPIICKVLTPAFRFINKLFFKTELNDVEAKGCEDRLMEEDYLKALKDKSLMESKK